MDFAKLDIDYRRVLAHDMQKYIVALALFIVPASGYGGDLRRFLVPTVASGQPGAFGSIWESELWVHSTAGGLREIRIPVICPVLCGPTFVIEGGQSRLANLEPQPAATGLVGYTEVAEEDLTLSFRIRDRSRQALTWGTTLPVVWDSEFRPRLHLLPVPIADRFRSTLRIYAFDDARVTSVKVRAFTLTGRQQTLAEHVLNLEPPPAPAFPDVGLQFKPWYSQWDVESLFPEAAAHSHIGVEITTATAEQRIWAFVSVTNDETQHVTAVLP